MKKKVREKASRQERERWDQKGDQKTPPAWHHCEKKTLTKSGSNPGGNQGTPVTKKFHMTKEGGKADAKGRDRWDFREGHTQVWRQISTASDVGLFLRGVKAGPW